MTIYNHLLQALSLRIRKLTIVQMNEAISLHNVGQSYQQIGDKYDIIKSTIGNFFKQYKLLLVAFESKKKEIKPDHSEDIMSRIMAVNKRDRTQDTIIDLPIPPVPTDRFPWGPAVVFFIVLCFILWVIYGRGKT